MAEASEVARDAASAPANGREGREAMPRESHPDRRRVVAGTVMVVAGACLWGISGTVSKLLMDRTGVSPLWMTNVKMLAGSAVFFCFAAARTPDRLRDAVRSLRHPRELLGVIGMAVMAYLVLNASYFANVDVTNPATATVLQSLGVPMTLAAVCLHRRRRPYGREVLCFAMAVLGTFLL
ncbi:MAG: EamA family transporter, partial [Parafannyhessea sp.]|uniref:EamA family transporter n=1 Tax=Parafannyhessea sp. TaxID=2847324 RepID=UPI003F1285A8